MSRQPEEYEVERLVAKRTLRNGVVQYRIKWMNFPSTENTWEPLANMDCQELIDEFEENRMIIIGRLIFKFAFICSFFDRTFSSGTKMSENGREYLIRFNDGKIDFIASNVVKQKYPNRLVNFLENRIEFIKLRQTTSAHFPITLNSFDVVGETPSEILCKLFVWHSFF